MTAQRRTAVHEAGHAVAAYLLDRPFIEISVTSDAGANILGHVAHRIPAGFRPDIENGARHTGLIEQNIMILLAGAETEAAWLCRSDDPPRNWKALVRSGRTNDDEAVLDFAIRTGHGLETTAAYVAYLRHRVLDWTGRDGDAGNDQFWHLVNHLADAVLESGRLSWRRARTVLLESERERIRLRRRTEGGRQT